MSPLNKLYQVIFDILNSEESRRQIGLNILQVFNIEGNPLIKNFGEVEQKIDGSNLSNISKFSNIVGSSKLSLEKIYSQRTRVNYITLSFSLLLCFIAVGLIFYIGLNEYQNNDNPDNVSSWWHAISAVLSSVIGGVLFYFHKESNKSRTGIENDIRFLAKLEGIVLSLENVNDEQIKKQLIEKIVLQLHK